MPRVGDSAGGPTPRIVRRVGELLWEAWGDRARPEEIPLRDDPLSCLIRTILSQNTTDVNADRAWEKLRRRYPDWHSALAAEPCELEETIRVAGLAEQKGPTIQRALNRAREERGALSLDFLADLSPAAAAAWLEGLSGVGPKTAACVLLFSLGMPVFPVDTHCLRIGKRLGWIPPGEPADRAHRTMAALIPHGAHLELHLGMVRHGRAVCHPRGPECPGCVVRRYCAFAREAGGG